MIPPVLVNDMPLYRGRAGVTIVLENIIQHWPAEHDLQPVGFLSRWNRGRWPDRPRPAEALTPLTLTPLKDLRRPNRRLPSAARRVVRGAHEAAFALDSRLRGYSACWEPNFLAIPSGLPTVSTMHDLSVLEHPEWHPADRVNAWESRLARAIQVTASWMVPADFTIQRMMTVLGIPRDRIEFIPLAARPLPYPAPDETPAALDTAGLPQRYLVLFGTIEPRKGIDIVLDAWAAQPASVRDACRLIVAGAPGWGGTSFWNTIVDHPVAGEVLATGYVTDTQAALLLAGARATLLGSRYEGFGLPILESMACGTPVVCSDIPAYREVAGDAAARIDPDDADGWVSAIRHAVDSPEWAAPLIEAGYEQEKRFSWTQTADRLVAVIDAAMRRERDPG